MNYTELLKDINYLSYLGAFAKWILLFLFIAGIILFLAYKLDLFKRKNRTVNILAKSYYVFIPLFFFMSALKFAPIYNTQKQLNIIIDNNKEFLTTYTTLFFNSFASDSSSLDTLSLDEYVDNQIYLFITNNRSENSSNNKIGEKILRKVATQIEYGFLRKIIESKIIKKSASLTGADKHALRTVYKSDMDKLFRKGELIAVFKEQVNHIFKGIYKSMLLFFFIFLLIPAAEIIAAKTLKY